jgi:prepilin-type N-terminal cleavage/methylation domain-containing protein
MKILRPRHRKIEQAGFTLVELLVVIGILGVIMAVTIIAINPSVQFQNARNAQRQADVSTILDAVYEYEATNAGALPPGASSVTTTAKDLGALAAQSATGTSLAGSNLTFNGLSGNIILTGGSVTVSGCSQAGDNGTWPVVSGTATTLIVTDAGGSAISATGCSISGWTMRIDLCTNLVPTFIAAMPMDPSGSTGTQCASTYKTGYQIAINAAGNRYTVNAPSAENSATISVSR